MHEHILRPESFGDRAHLLLVGEVDRELALAVEDGDIVPGRGQDADDRSSDPARATGYDRRSLRRAHPSDPMRVISSSRKRSESMPTATWQLRSHELSRERSTWVRPREGSGPTSTTTPTCSVVSSPASIT